MLTASARAAGVAPRIGRYPVFERIGIGQDGRRRDPGDVTVPRGAELATSGG